MRPQRHSRDAPALADVQVAACADRFGGRRCRRSKEDFGADFRLSACVASMQSANLPAGRVTAQAPTEAGGGGAAPICRRVSGRTLLLSSHAGHESAGILPTEMIGLRWGSEQKGAAAPNGLVIGLLECRPPFHWWSLTAFVQSHTHWTRLTDHGGCAGRDTAWWSPRPRHRGGAGSWGLGSIAAVGSAC